MPQASLLSYFSKAVPSGNLARDADTIEGAEEAADSENVPHSQNISPRTKALGILDEISRQTSKESTTTATRHLTVAATGNHTEHEKLPQLPPPIDENPDVHSTTSPQIITIPHLPQALITHVCPSHLPSIQRLTVTTLPVRYGDTFFASTLTDPIATQLSRVVLYASEPVGWIRCRLEPCSSSASQPQLSQIYIQALALLSPYRHLGLASLLLDTILASPIAMAGETVCIYAHVWEKNEDALEWYARRGFKRVLLAERYYRRLKPGGAWIVRKELDVT